MISALAALCLVKTSTIVVDGTYAGLEGNIVAVQTATAMHRGLATPKTRFWREGKPCALKDIAIGASVRARLKTDASGVELRELADAPSALLLEKIRTTYLPVVVARTDSQGYWFTLPGGTEHFYKVTASSKIDRGVLRAGDRVWVRGRMLASLDTALAHATEQAPPNVPAPTPGGPKPSPVKPVKPLPPAGEVDVRIVAIMGRMTMFDVMYEDRIYHITYDRYTLFLDAKRSVPFDDSWFKNDVRLKVRQDRYGRFIAIRVTR